MKNRGCFNLFSFLFCSFSSLTIFAAKTETRVAWIELRGKAGEVIQLEPDFFYAHVAIQIGSQWVHAHPKRGVEKVEQVELEKLGLIREVWSSFGENDSYIEKIPYYLGRDFDAEFSWSDEKIYCAELVAKLLGINPSPMHFDENLWDPWFKKYEGLPGSSPSKLYQEVQRRGYQRVY